MTMAKLFEIENTDILVSGSITLFLSYGSIR